MSEDVTEATVDTGKEESEEKKRLQEKSSEASNGEAMYLAVRGRRRHTK